ncbi:Reverse transcriptase (RNA-dependent DNA polymerase) [Fragilaria crotonensis]|nr:Reverse transcriptase (RNA-dependent DNA polymerase) [Fragilaria crotonensis]
MLSKWKVIVARGRSRIQVNCKTPFPSTTYRPEVDTTDECDDQYASQYQNLIGVLRWAVKLGRIDIYTEVALLSQHLALPRMGHLEAVYHVFAYLNKHDKSQIIFDPTDPVPVTPTNHRPDWSSFYQQLEEELPPKMPEPLGNPVALHVFVDANHAGNVVTRRSHTCNDTGTRVYCTVTCAEPTECERETYIRTQSRLVVYGRA